MIPTALLALLLTLVADVSAVPTTAVRREPLSIPLVRHGGLHRRNRSPETYRHWADNLKGKYGIPVTTPPSKRAQATVAMTNQNADSSYFGMFVSAPRLVWAGCT